jgi:hypothetical protein|tara:strand:+ start:1972 stop:2322 length:351 start_codon:yes stop_codon:yes gene_type:complete
MKNYKTFFENTILDSIFLEDYDITTSSDVESINEVYKIFKSESVRKHNKHLKETVIFTEWLQGLPSVFDIPFCRYEILDNAKENGLKFKTVTAEDNFVNDYCTNLSDAFFTLKNNL